VSSITSKSNIVGEAIPNIPWEDRPEGVKGVVWRSPKNPIIPRDLLKYSNSIFNSAVVPYQGQFAGVFRCDDTRRRVALHAGFSPDGYTWSINEERIKFDNEDNDAFKFDYGYDPRVVWVDDRYYVTWCNGLKGEPTIGVAYTKDFKTFHQLENAFLPYNRNGVLFPRKINGNYAMLSRPSDPGHTPFGDIYYSESPDMSFWGKHRHVMTKCGGWQFMKIGAGPVPIETSEGWLLIYHGVMRSCGGYVYSMGVVLLDLDEPWRVIKRPAPYIMSPQALYELVGDTPNVVFPCATLCDAPTGRLAIYYGAADTVTCLAYGYVQDLIEFAKQDDQTIDPKYK